MATISSLGIGSSLPLSTLLDNLTTAEKKGLTPITNQQLTVAAKLTAYGTLKSALTAFQTANTALSDAGLFSATSASNSATAFTATTGANATAGKYNISVSKLAQAQSLTSATRSSLSENIGSTTASGTRTITIQQNNGSDPVTISLNDSDTTMTGVRDAINNAKAGVSASIIKVSDNSYRLAISAKDTGKSNAMTISVSGDDTLNNLIGYDGSNSDESKGMIQTVAAQNASLTINNVAIDSASNTISDALQGVTLNLNDVTSGNQTLTISKDTSKASSAITDWVNAYNSLQDTFSSLTKYTAVDTDAKTQDPNNGALVGDSTVRTIQTQLKNLLAASNSTSNIKTLSQIGITSDPSNGKLTIDSDKLASGLNDHASDIQQMISGDGKKSGITTAIGNNLTSYMSSTGILTAAANGASTTNKKLTQEFNEANKRINKNIEHYKKQFTELDKLVTQLKSTGDFLTQQFDALNNASGK
ncbi:flagellar filament capping protein FliD [Erwinia sp. OLTSP20]|uniref:flagellar filament capping protein FliD n=1 Tax=unclassified Erwinia TaxID=2622719 RepID=UPI000C1A1D32|nr:MULTISPECIES: flagellar filament capping protein FliD [unclassified Erwinia]PIJ48339.1 flagellar filament capping protein FliD [Erwinia sp. OAMSP11]PIJ68692.1 flagellar filament capping protein FliD [Erwinia sp. OLSSP12]PIJ78840.1 flagellar filament capping protein FliD [Erwinia sp. OLCASP19]PIJ79810.1 flagellar filament capping protein FliD [Erwinia sp. OLMTSP26]PIJ81215.1 flagellar filament capping protein FliD [Erwinia sp. OLMDSP33]